eukprot:988121-Rhodomonas_salina.1
MILPNSLAGFKGLKASTCRCVPGPSPSSCHGVPIITEQALVRVKHELGKLYGGLSASESVLYGKVRNTVERRAMVSHGPGHCLSVSPGAGVSR